MDPFGLPRIYTCTFEEALRPPRSNLPPRLTLDWRPAPTSASHAWLRFALGALTNDSFEAWERDPQVTRRTQGQPSWSRVRLEGLMY